MFSVYRCLGYLDLHSYVIVQQMSGARAGRSGGRPRLTDRRRSRAAAGRADRLRSRRAVCSVHWSREPAPFSSE